VVLSIDEKSQIQALDRTQPGLPIKLGRCTQRHREFIRFLNAVERQVAAGRPIHVVLDNYATHKHPKVLAWLARHPRWTFHFTPTSASWLNAVANFFSKMTRQRIRRGRQALERRSPPCAGILRIATLVSRRCDRLRVAG
jgi:hypothetical protein